MSLKSILIFFVFSISSFSAFADCTLPAAVKSQFEKAKAFQSKCGSIFKNAPSRMIINSYDGAAKTQKMYVINSEDGSCMDSASVGMGKGSKDFRPGCSAKSNRSPPGYFRLGPHAGASFSTSEKTAFFAQSLQGQGTGCDREGDESCILLHRDRRAAAGTASSLGCSTLSGADWERLKKLFEPGMMMINDFGDAAVEGCEGYKKMAASGDCRPGKKGNADLSSGSDGGSGISGEAPQERDQ